MTPLLEAVEVSKAFNGVHALDGVSLEVNAGRVLCLLGDNGAGKSTLIKILSGVHPPDAGVLRFEGEEVYFRSPSQALDRGIGTVYQDLAVVQIMPMYRNFFLGREPTRGWGPWRRLDVRRAKEVTTEQLGEIGINLRSPNQRTVSLSGGERQCLAIAKAVYFGARVLILDEPTSALGVKQAAIVLRYIRQAKARGLGIVFVTHNVNHAYPIGDTFTILSHGHSYGTLTKDEVSREEVTSMMAGGADLEALDAA